MAAVVRPVTPQICLAFLAGLALAGCEGMPASGTPFQPARVETAPAEAPAEADETLATEPQGGFDFAADARSDEDPEDADLSTADIYAGLGLGKPPDDLERPPAPESPVPPPTPAEPAPPIPSAPTAALPMTWQPGVPLDGSWGVRLVSTVIEAQPPRAILGMPDGTEAVVQPGTLLPDASLVVLAIGRDVVQVAEIVPVGDHARVQTHLLQSLYGQPPPQP